jgi:phenylacetate-coenzyme A ligase PaaK-like adenylate-forming protein
MAAIDELRGFVEQLKREGSIRSDLPPAKEEKYFNPFAETMPRDKLSELRDAHIRHIVNWAYEKSPFYRNMWDEAKVSPDEIHGYDDLEKLPFMRKGGKWGLRTDQLQHPPYGTRFVEELLPHIKWEFKSTGTTGVSTYQPWTHEEFIGIVFEGFGRMFWAAGCKRGGVFIHFIPIDRFYAATPAFDSLARYGLGAVSCFEGMMRLLTAPQEFAEDVSKTLEEMSKYHRPIFTAFNTPMLINLGRVFTQYGKVSPFDYLLEQGEPMTKESRDAIRKANPKAQVSYGYTTTEGNSGVECPESAAKDGALGWHMWEDLSIYEVVDPETGKRVPKGERGELLITTFHHHMLPVIRFSVEDVAINDFDDSVCECGRTHRRWLYPVQGRTVDLFKVKGKEVLPWDIEKTMPKVPEAVGPFQITADAWDMDSLKVKIETTRTLPDEEYKGRVRNILQDALEPVERGALVRPGAWKIIRFIDNRPEKD